MNMIQLLRRRATAFALVLTSMPTLVGAQVPAYDAGTPAYPSSAPDRQSQGWNILDIGFTQRGSIPGAGANDPNSSEMAGTDAVLACNVLNRMRILGWPSSVKVPR